MDSNALLHYLRGFFELVPEPTADQIRGIRTQVLQATPVTPQLIPVEVRNPMHMPGGAGDCGCHGKSTKPPPPPTLDRSRLPE